MARLACAAAAAAAVLLVLSTVPLERSLLVTAAAAAAAESSGSLPPATAPRRPRTLARPGRLALKDTPQFLVLTHDDWVDEESAGNILRITAGLRNPNGCGVPATWFATTKRTNCTWVRRLHALGHEIAAHTATHPRGLRGLARRELEAEVLGGRAWLVDTCGVPKAHVVGFRTPYLQSSAELLALLARERFRYDSTFAEPWPADEAAARPWPYTLDNGIPVRCGFVDTPLCPKQRFPGLWEVPLYSYEGVRHQLDRPNPHAAFLRELRLKYKSNRAPVMVPCHTSTGYLRNATTLLEVRAFLAQALERYPGTWAVTITQLLDWMQRPVPLRDMPQFAAGASCGVGT